MTTTTTGEAIAEKNWAAFNKEQARKQRAKKSAATKKRNRLAAKNAAWGMWAEKALSMDELQIIAVDPANSCGLAFVKNGKIDLVTLLDATPQEAYRVMKARVTPGTVAVLEGQFVGGVGGDSIRIIEKRVMVQTILRLLGVFCIVVMPGEWQAEFLGKPPKRPDDVPSKGYRTKWLKERSLELASFLQPNNDDEADAANIGRWANNKIGLPSIKGETP